LRLITTIPFFCDKGVPNAQLVQEKSPLAVLYNNQSIAEQNSVDIAFSLLMEDRYQDLRRTIYTDDAEMKRFRQHIVNSVMATDIVDKELKVLRNARWEKAFSENSGVYFDETDRDKINRKATIVIEHLIQASDVAHTMQHWHIYRKWNEHFFKECYQAYKMGRAEVDPSLNWYNGEIGFFDFYIIPLAKKLKNCGVFGVSSDEYLNYATKNRAEWETRGKEIVAEMVIKASKLWVVNERSLELQDNKVS
jgi:3'5'-cyclic nucleotide phosphodiesterase